MAGGALVDLALSFPHEFRGLSRRPYLRWIGYTIALGLSLYAFTTLYDFAHPLAYVIAWRWIYAFVGLTSLTYLLINVYYGMTASVAGHQDPGAHDRHRLADCLWTRNHLAAHGAPAYL